MWWPMHVCSPWATMKSSAVAPFARNASATACLRRSEVSGSPSRWRTPSIRLGGAEQVCSGARARLCRDLCAADALELACRLRAAPRGEERPVDVEDDACRRAAGRQARRGTRPGRPPPDTELRTCPRCDLEHRLRPNRGRSRRSSSRPSDSSGENGHPLDLAHSRRLERANHRVAVAVSLDVEERVGDGVGHLDSELGTPHRVSEDEDARHRSSLSGALSQDCGDPARNR